ncbi:MAG: hypothetical protein AAGF75_03285, partial [Cyanobacteria bacterium P01_H01_bin.130]
LVLELANIEVDLVWTRYANNAIAENLLKSLTSEDFRLDYIWTRKRADGLSKGPCHGAGE